MVSDRRYKRYFIILENEDSGFEKTNKRVPKGYAKIEVRNGKGLLNVYVQDLKYFKDANYIYRNYLISTKGKEGLYVDTGAFMIDERGKGEIKVKFNPDNVEGSNRSIEDFNVVAVIARPIERSSRDMEIYGPLVGYMDKEKANWKDVIVYEDKGVDEDLDAQYKEKYEEIIDAIEKSSKELYKDTKEEEDKKEKIEKEEEKESDKSDYKDKGKDYYECVDSLEKYDNKKMKQEKEESVNENIEADKKEPHKKEKVNEEKKASYKKKNIYKEKKQEKQENIKEEENVKPQININKKAIYKKENIKQEKKEKVIEEKKGKGQKGNTRYSRIQTTDVHYKKYHKMVYKYVKDILKYHEKVQPFEKNTNGYTWWKIPYDRQSMYRGFLPFFGYVLSIYCYNPYIYYMNNCQNLMNKYGHYIFGVVYDKDREPKHYVYGVPGRYMYRDQPFQGMTGFVCWHPLEDKKPEAGDYGYWLLHIDSKTGNVVFPMKPTVPPVY